MENSLFLTTLWQIMYNTIYNLLNNTALHLISITSVCRESYARAGHFVFIELELYKHVLFYF